ncbi:hypothetical protein DYB25_010603 [Aphanomyces astaci]|uniref:subtilisin n=1 Tax=Aphanomyces astaci TaxID=112090 RepID=A0A397CKQ4_APHAT|nr:hypothetical protein DYB25_010603 [Aphanomyces astaci]RHY39902.1 hypothetical protein DYB30_007988 [Aphanomyces astaci]RHY45606.1 hypothetical protein DYB38_013356 [Aphanomyces astaci]RHY73951.1 hypothetical protein DYB34_011232 [Aphanomyces astaci]RHY83693.1 hypothetical protein DYB35_013649 [Aphanomyces astaci]
MQLLSHPMHLSCLLLLMLIHVHAAMMATSKLSPAVASLVLSQNGSMGPVVVEFAALPAFEANALAALPRAERLKAVTTHLQRTAKQCQGRVLALIIEVMTDDRSLQAQSFFISNRIFLNHATASLILAMASDPAIPHKLRIMLIERIGASLAWHRGVCGANVVVATIDTGVRRTHDSLNATFRSDHGWYDATVTAAENSAQPVGYGGHGTAVTAAAVGGSRAGSEAWLQVPRESHALRVVTAAARSER